jgi:predicted nucleic acid-binding protein
MNSTTLMLHLEPGITDVQSKHEQDCSHVHQSNRNTFGSIRAHAIQGGGSRSRAETGNDGPSESHSQTARQVTEHIAGRYVIDTNVAVYAALPMQALKPEMLEVATAARWFMARARQHRAELHAPHLMFSEAANVIYREAIAKGVLSFEDGLEVIKSIQKDVPWTRHTPEDRRVYDLQRALQRTHSTGDAEFLAVAEVMGCEVITADESLFKSAAQHKIVVPVVLVRDHPWAHPGVLDDFPPRG